MCELCRTYIKFDDYWKQILELDMNKNNYISMTNLSDLLWREQFTVKEMNKVIQDFQLEQEKVPLLDENIAFDYKEFWNQKTNVFRLLFL